MVYCCRQKIVRRLKKMWLYLVELNLFYQNVIVDKTNSSIGYDFNNQFSCL